MSAGDVQFVGWTGGDPMYKELPPQVQIEPAGENISKRVTINRICFDKDKQAVIQQLPTGNAVMTSVYIDTDGSTKTQAMGGGYTLLSVSDAPIAKGYSRISAVYSKVVNGIFEVGLPAGMSISCDAGKCKIKYNSTVLEEIDSGTEECTSELLADIEFRQAIQVGKRPLILDVNKFATASVSVDGVVSWSGDFYPTSPPLRYKTVDIYDLYKRKNVFLLNMLCNESLFETVSLTNEDLFDSKSLTFKGEPVASGIHQESLDTDPNQSLEINAILGRAYQAYAETPTPGFELQSIDYEIYKTVDFDANGPFYPDYPLYYRLMPTYTTSYAEWSYTPKLEWKKVGNKVTLQYGRGIIREYDVTGL